MKKPTDPSADLDSLLKATALENARLRQELSAKEDLRSQLLEKLISAQEDERKRIARELHDEASQALTALIIGLESIEDSLPAELGEARRRLGRIKTLTVQTLEEVRKIIVDLRPTAIDDLGLIPALRWYSRTQADRYGLRLTFVARGFQGRLPSQMEIALFRVVQEAITNIARHAKARAVKVQMAMDDSRVRALVEDDGEGFAVDRSFGPAGSDTGLGLLGMKERVSLLGGTLEIDSTPGRGTRVIVEVPVAGRRGESS